MADVAPSLVNPPYGYGHDLSCTTDLDPSMAEVDGRQLLGQALARRLQVPRGGLIDDPNYGTCVSDFIDDDMQTSDLARLTAMIDAECAKDERVVSTSTTVVLVAPGVLTITINVTDRNGAFRLVLAATSIDLKILKGF
jgi:hypothetical protein